MLFWGFVIDKLINELVFPLVVVSLLLECKNVARKIGLVKFIATIILNYKLKKWFVSYYSIFINILIFKIWDWEVLNIKKTKINEL